MIYDSLENFSRYAKLSPEVWKEISKFLTRCTPEKPVGRYELDGDRVYASVQHYETHPANPDKLEIHRNYIDIQLLLLGEESIPVRSVDGLTETVPYDEKRDIAFYRLPVDDPDAVTTVLVPGKFAIFFPGEGHLPGVIRGNVPCPAVKVVVKIAATVLA